MKALNQAEILQVAMQNNKDVTGKVAFQLGLDQAKWLHDNGYKVIKATKAKP